jgi:phosphotransferase system enzyme I (PtsP)
METDHIKMLCDIGELNGLFGETTVEDCLSRTVDMVAGHMRAEVCSIYLYDETSEELVLKATKGLSQESVGSIKLKLGEGLVGTTLKELRPVREDRGSDNPLFKFYPGINEELYEAFLAVPILRGTVRIGVLVVQRLRGKKFSEKDLMALKATASQLASMLENITFMISRYRKAEKKDRDFDFGKFRFLKGKSASKGFAHAGAMVLKHDLGELVHSLLNSGTHYTIDDFESALKETEHQLEELQQQVEETLSDAASLIFSSHLLMLKDNGFTGGMREQIVSGIAPPRAVFEIFNYYRSIFAESANTLIREKVQDIEDLAKRILHNLSAGNASEQKEYSGRILIAQDLFPSELLKMSAEGIEGIVLESGGVTSHVAILARSLRIPLIFIDEPELLNVPEGTPLLVDADTGNLYINPSPDVINRFTEKADAEKIFLSENIYLKNKTFSRDGTRVSLMVNINLLSDIHQAHDIQMDGVGLYRTEFPFMIRSTFPTEEEQYIIYRKLVEEMGEKPVTFRTLDIGGDKVLSYYDSLKEENPFLGLRSIRFSLRHEEIFIQQIRAILRAGAGKNIRIMFPMISSMDEFIASKDILLRCINDLREEGYDHNPAPEIGMMVEIPSVITIIEDLAETADFFSVGTNDLIQYTLAVDRTNEKVSDMYIPHHPALLRSLKIIADAAGKSGTDLSICGDMANNSVYIPFLLGIGIRGLSVDAMYIPGVKQTIAGIDIAEAEKHAAELLKASRISDIESILGLL